MLADRVLIVTGTGQADVIEFVYARTMFTVIANGRASTFPTRDVKTIRIDAWASDDTVLLGRKLPIRASINGGEGNAAWVAGPVMTQSWGVEPRHDRRQSRSGLSRW